MEAESGGAIEGFGDRRGVRFLVKIADVKAVTPVAAAVVVTEALVAGFPGVIRRDEEFVDIVDGFLGDPKIAVAGFPSSDVAVEPFGERQPF